ncbi:Hypothetical predicted protein [Octopus vulgaris]|uniref:Uncharacterized protein n=1 Tax=Octopus vulgaris TaxID=6645 RepID=A0AA36EX62_OCTVU|nr:Hypothetical predicted protein [Octopus vulgaris]
MGLKTEEGSIRDFLVCGDVCTPILERRRWMQGRGKCTAEGVHSRRNENYSDSDTIFGTMKNNEKKVNHIKSNKSIVKSQQVIRENEAQWIVAWSLLFSVQAPYDSKLTLVQDPQARADMVLYHADMIVTPN